MNKIKMLRLIIIMFVFSLVIPFKMSAEQYGDVHRGLFVSVIQTPTVLSNKKEILKLIDFSKRAGIKVLYVQIYRANQAWFPSSVGDSEPFRECLKNVGEDPLKLMINEAHKNGIKVHAWVNLLSLSDNKDAKILKKYGPCILTCNKNLKEKIEDYKIDNQYFLEPGDTNVRKELLKVVDEILTRYKGLDGIQFDYIRYPDREPRYGYTKINIERFKLKTGCEIFDENTMVWRQWKKDQVTELLRLLVKESKIIHPGIIVSTTGCSPYIRALEEAFQDWPSWIESGLVDFVTIMSYSKETFVFEKYILELKNKKIDFNRINIGIGAYVLGNTPEMFEKQIKFCEKIMNKEYVIFHYGSICDNPKLDKFLVKSK